MKTPFSSIFKLLLFIILIGGSNAYILYSVWHSESSHAMTLGGYLPYADIVYYYNSMLSLIDTGILLPIGSERPFGILFFTSLLFLCKGNIMLFFIVFNIIQSGVFIIVSKIISQTYGYIFGLGIGLLLVLINVLNQGKFILESPACLFSAAAFGLLFYGATKKYLFASVFGLVIMCTAQNIRLGPIAILPAIGLFIAWQHRVKYFLNFRVLILTASVVMLFLASNKFIISIYGSTNSLASNSSYLIYGLAHGGQNWQYARKELPELFKDHISEEQRTSTITRYAFKHINEAPLELVNGILHNWSFAMANYSRLFLRSYQSFFKLFKYRSHWFNNTFPNVLCLLMYAISFIYSIKYKNSFLLLCIVISVTAVLCAPITGMQASLFRLFRPTEIFAVYPIVFVLFIFVNKILNVQNK